MPQLYRALLICSDEGCEAEIVVEDRLEEIEVLLCDCGAGFHLVRWAEPLES